MTSRGAADRKKWDELYASGARPDRPPSPWVLETVRALPNELVAIDVAGGTGRHAIPVARAGRAVVLVDIVTQAVATARAAEPSLSVVVADVAELPFGPRSFGCVMVVNFLDRALVGDLISLLAPGGFLVYETYTRSHLDLVNRGLARGPHSLQYLLEAGELPELARPLDVIEYWEGEVEDAAGRRRCARLLAQNPARG
jgi:SAM-dependent methyltransferase